MCLENVSIINYGGKDMKTIINDTYFEKINRDAIDFYNAHGWVVIENGIQGDLLDDSLESWERHRQQCAKEMEISFEKYKQEISQWRDLWTLGGIFREILDSSESVRAIAQKGMDWIGIRLLHDHIIAKPAGSSNKKIPWHQDSMFWPVDLPGCSTWTPLEDVSIEGGCLEVVDSSHLEGCEKPIDFMAEERWDFPEDSVRVKLPVKAGYTILLHSLTWHRSSPNSTSSDRPAHIGLWVHTGVHWRPDMVDWHPLNDNVEASPGEQLIGEMFPTWGVVEEIEKPDQDIHGGTTRTGGISMFDASTILGNQIRHILNSEGNLSTLLNDEENRNIVASKTISKGFAQESDRKTLTDILERLYICHAAYVLHRARNVFNATYADWWEIAGQSWSKTEINYD